MYSFAFMDLIKCNTSTDYTAELSFQEDRRVTLCLCVHVCVSVFMCVCALTKLWFIFHCCHILIPCWDKNGPWKSPCGNHRRQWWACNCFALRKRVMNNLLALQEGWVKRILVREIELRRSPHIEVWFLHILHMVVVIDTDK